MNLRDIPFLIHVVYYDVAPPSAAIISSSLLGRLSTMLAVFMGIFEHSSTSTFVRLGTDVG